VTRGAGLLGLVRSGLRLDRSQSDPWVALRNTVGVVAPLVLAVGTDSPTSAGLASTVGALQTAFADRPGPYRLRLLRMLGTALAAGTTSALAVAGSRSDAWSVLLLAVLAFVTGLLLAGGPSATQVGVAGVAAALLIGHLPQPAGNAVHVGLLVLAGGAVQTVLAVLAWPLGRHRPERRAVAAVYRELAGLTRRPLGTSVGPPNVAVLTDVRQTLYGLGHDHGPSVEAYRVLLDEAERIRREVLVLGGALEWLDRTPGRGGELRATLAAVADVLDGIALALERGRRVDPDLLRPARAAVRSTAAVLDDSGDLGQRSAAARLRSLAGQLRAAVETAAVGASEGRSPEPPDTVGARGLRAPLEIVRANVTPGSPVLRHAVRLAFFVAGSDLVVRLAGLSRGYWVPLTLLVVLRPDFAATFQRAVLRVAGTLLGLVVATVLIHYVPGGEWYRIALVALFCFLLRLAGPVNVAPTAFALAGLVVLLLDVQGVSAHATAIARGEATAAGGALALVAVLVRPSWERQYVRARLADLLAAYRDYLRVVGDLDTPSARLQRARTAARLARTNAQASLDRARAEPVSASGELDLGGSVLAHSHRLIHSLLTLDALRPELRRAAPVPRLRTLLREADQALADAERALREARPAPRTTGLRTLQSELAESVLADPASVGGDHTAGALVDATDRMTNSVDTLLAVLAGASGSAEDVGSGRELRRS
jgi:uncharacterized membrane protein YccC